MTRGGHEPAVVAGGPQREPSDGALPTLVVAVEDVDSLLRPPRERHGVEVDPEHREVAPGGASRSGGAWITVALVTIAASSYLLLNSD